MEKLVVVIGATGRQGGSVVKALTASQKYRVRGVTRNLQSAESKRLAEEGVDMVIADLDDYESLLKAFEGAFFIFGVTDYDEQLRQHGPEAAGTHELAQAVNLAKAAAATPTLEHYIWSTLPPASALSHGRHKVPHFESKASADEYIHKHLPRLAAKTTFLWVGYYASNIGALPMTATLHTTSMKNIWLSPVTANTVIVSAGNDMHNIGVYVAAILAQPSLTLPAKYVLPDAETTTLGNIVTKYGDTIGTPTRLVNIGPKAFDDLFPGWDAITKMFLCWQEMGAQTFSKPGVVLLTGRDLGIPREDPRAMEETFRGLV